MTNHPTILSITGSDGTGGAGVQADVKTITTLGANAMTAITSVTVQSRSSIRHVHLLPPEVVADQVRAIVDDSHPKAIKIGLVGDAAALQAMRSHVAGCRHVVCDPGILSSHGTRLMDDNAIAALKHHILPHTELLVLRCNEAELMLGTTIRTDNDMLRVARDLADMGPEWVMLRSGHHAAGVVTALVFNEEQYRFFSSHNVEGWQRHGIGGVLSSAIATRLAFGDDVPTAIRNAHNYLHSQVVYGVDSNGQRPAELYNHLLDLIADHFREAHDVGYYADRMAITPRYLAQVTKNTVGKTPKQIIDEYIMHEAETLLTCTTHNMQEISDALGFKSQIQFSKFVQNKRQCSPTELRKASAV